MEKMFVSVQSSITGFHNPKKHHGMKDGEFLTLYKEYAKRKRKHYYEFLLQNEYYFLSYIRKHLLQRKRVF